MLQIEEDIKFEWIDVLRMAGAMVIIGISFGVSLGLFLRLCFWCMP